MLYNKSTTNPQQVEMLYNKSTTNRISGVWLLWGIIRSPGLWDAMYKSWVYVLQKLKIRRTDEAESHVSSVVVNLTIIALRAHSLASFATAGQFQTSILPWQPTQQRHLICTCQWLIVSLIIVQRSSELQTIALISGKAVTSITERTWVQLKIETPAQ